MFELDRPSKTAADQPLHENSRGDKTAIELFIAGIRAWEAALRRHCSGKPDGEALP